MIMKIQNESWTDWNHLRSRPALYSGHFSSNSINYPWYRSKSWRYHMQFSTSTLSRQWSGINNI